MNQEKILVILTGGTIDSLWDGRTDTAVVASKSTLPDFFASMILYAEFVFEEVCMKDSRQITPEDIQRVCQVCEMTECTKIIITHGTYTMPDTARYLEANLARKDQTIVFTGSMVPLKGFDPSDAGFNLGYAVSSVKLLPYGVHICMNGRSFSTSEVAKSLSEGKFYSVFEKRQ